MSAFTPGARVVWLHETRGGYGYVERIPARVVRQTARKVTIEVATVAGELKQVSVAPENLQFPSEAR